MNPTSQTREEMLFALALEKPADKRAGFLDAVCDGDAALRQGLEARLAAHAQPETLLATLPDDPNRTMKAVRASDPPDEAVGQTLGRYKLLEKLGEGGCGIVYVAEQTEPVRRRVALKVIKLGMDTRAVVARFEAERQALALMDHPNIARVLDAGTTEHGRPYFVMELVRGIRITEYCDQSNLSTKERLDLFIKVCQAIQHAHQKGIIHRDIKPSNILVTMHDGVPVPKVIDFGIAKATEGRLTDATVYTQLHQFIGTPAYMSPEQAEMSGLDVDTRSDIYSLGVLLYELLTGKTPFDASELMSQGIDAMRKTIREKDPVRPSTKLADLKGDELTTTAKRRSVEAAKLSKLLRGDLDWIVMKCLEKDRTRRYETANGLALDLRRYLNCEPVIARPPSKLYELQKAVRRHKVGFAATAAIIIALAVGVAFSSWQAVRATRAKRDALSARADADTRRVEADAARQAEQVQREKAEQARANESAQRRIAESNATQARDSARQSRRLLYAADMNLAQQAVQFNNLGRARRLLERHRPPPGEEDLRGWEWRYLWQQCQSDALAVLAKHPARGFSVSFSPDGGLLAAAYFDGRVELWDVNRRVLLKELNAAGGPAHVAFSPRTNLLAFSGGPARIKLHDLATGRETVLWQGTQNVRDLSFVADGSRLLAFTYGQGPSRVMVFDVAQGVAISTNNTSGATVHMGIARMSSDKQRLFLSDMNILTRQMRVKCIDHNTSQELWTAEIAIDYGVSAMALSPDDKVLVTGTGYEDGTIRVWDSATGKLLAKLEGHTGWVGEVTFSRDGRWLVSAAADQSLRLWETSTWTEAMVFRGHGDEVHAVAFSPDGKLLASGGKDGAIMLWDITARQSTRGHRLLPPTVVFATEIDPGIAAASDLSETKPIILRLDDLSKTPIRFEINTNLALNFLLPNLITVYDQTNTLQLVEMRNETPKLLRALAVGAKVVQYPGRGGAAMAHCPQEHLVAWGDAPGVVHLATLDQSARRWQWNSDLSDPMPLAFSPDGKLLVLTGTPIAGGLEIREVNTGKLILHSALRLYRGQAMFANRGRTFVAVLADTPASRSVVFWNLTQPGSEPVRFTERGTQSGLSVSPDGRWISVSSQDGFVVLYDAETLERQKVLYGHMQGVHGVAFSPDNKTLVSGSGGREAVKLWHVETGQELLTLPGKGSLLNNVQFVDSGNALLIGGAGQKGAWQIWRAPAWEEIKTAEAKQTMGTKQP
jgi:WD40 repeat protein/serine/threonine protein kinase